MQNFLFHFCDFDCIFAELNEIYDTTVREFGIQLRIYLALIRPDRVPVRRTRVGTGNVAT